MKNTVKNQLNSDYSVATKTLNTILARGKLNHKEITSILKLENLVIVGEFLQEYQYFDAIDLTYIKDFLIYNLDNSDRLFVSDLIEFAGKWEIELPYKKCIEMLKVYEDDNTYVQLSLTTYLFENLKIVHIEHLFSTLCEVLNNPECNQSVQIKAAFFLFRITHKKEFLNDLVDLVVNGSDNKELLQNLLLIDYNSEEYFEYYSLLLAILP